MASDPLALLIHESASTPTSAVVVLHGHGDDPAPLVERISDHVPDGVTVLAPVGPARAADGTPAWFVSVPGDRPAREGDEGSLAEALGRLAATVAMWSSGSGISPGSLLGYSQGAATSLALAFGSAPEPRWRPEAVVTVAGWLPAEPDLVWDVAGAAGTTRALLLHGADDDVVDPQLGRSAARVLDRAGVAVTFTEIPCDHALDDDGITRASAFFAAGS